MSRKPIYTEMPLEVAYSAFERMNLKDVMKLRNVDRAHRAYVDSFIHHLHTQKFGKTEKSLAAKIKDLEIADFIDKNPVEREIRMIHYVERNFGHYFHEDFEEQLQEDPEGVIRNVSDSYISKTANLPPRMKESAKWSLAKSYLDFMQELEEIDENDWIRGAFHILFDTLGFDTSDEVRQYVDSRNDLHWRLINCRGEDAGVYHLGGNLLSLFNMLTYNDKYGFDEQGYVRKIMSSYAPFYECVAREFNIVNAPDPDIIRKFFQHSHSQSQTPSQ
jgi:hypothetical protein